MLSANNGLLLGHALASSTAWSAVQCCPAQPCLHFCVQILTKSSEYQQLPLSAWLGVLCSAIS